MEIGLIVLLVFGAIVLGVLNVVEVLEYRRYQKAAHAVIGLGQGMQVSFQEVVEHLNNFNRQLSMIGADTILLEQDVNFIKAVLQVHTEALNLHSLGKSFELNDKMHNGDDLNVENTASTVQG